MLADTMLRRESVSRWTKNWGLAAAMMVLIFIFSAQPEPPDIRLFSIVIDGKDYSDKLKHFLAYALLGALVWRALVSSRRWRRVGAAVLISTLYGFTDEWHQVYVPGRSFDLLDLAADALGALTAAALLMLFRGGERVGKRRRAGQGIRG